MNFNNWIHSTSQNQKEPKIKDYNYYLFLHSEYEPIVFVKNVKKKKKSKTN